MNLLFYKENNLAIHKIPQTIKQPQLVYEHEQQVWHPDITNTDWLLFPQYFISQSFS